MFQPWKSDNGAVLPWEYLPAEAGTYHVGQALNLDATTGHLEAVAADLDTTPPYICNAEVKVETAGTPIPVSRTSRDVIYETTLQAAAAGTVAVGWWSRAAARRWAPGTAPLRWSAWTAPRQAASFAADSWTRSPRRAAVANHRPAEKGETRQCLLDLHFPRGLA